MDRLWLAERFTQIQEALADQSESFLDRTIAEWVVSADFHLPQAFLKRPIRDVLPLTFASLESMPGLGLRRIEKLLDVLERACGHLGKTSPQAIELEAWSGVSSLRGRWIELQRDFLSRTDDGILDQQVSEWVDLDDRGLPQGLLPLRLRDVLALSFAQLESSQGIGERKIEKLLGVLERARWCSKNLLDSKPDEPKSLNAEGDGDAARGPTPQAVAPENLTEGDWLDWRRAIRAHRMEHEHLGRLAASLGDLNYRLWLTPLGDYLDKPLWRIRSLPNHTPARVAQVLDVFARVVQSISGGSGDSPLAVRLSLTPVSRMALWAERTLRLGIVPDPQAIRDEFLTPLLSLLESDLGAETAMMVRRRIGDGDRGETLEQIANDVGLTRERVRQVTAKAAQVLRIRWPEGRSVLNGVHAFLSESPAAEEPLRLMGLVLDVCFELEVTRNGSRSEVLAAWARAGRAKRTPMNDDAVHSWAAEEFPHLPARTVRRWLIEDGLRYEDPNGQGMFFSDEPLDKLLLRLYSDPEPVTLEESRSLVGKDDPNGRFRANRDPRFLEDDSKRVTAAERGPFRRLHGRWFLKLEGIPASNAVRAVDSIAMSDLVHLLVGGLVQAGVCDATVWGVHRFAVAMLRRIRGATLPGSVTPFVLANALVIHSEGLVNPMRRRRLRWESADGSIPIRGKRGWVDRIAAEAGIPMTLDELDLALRDRFQDYEPYVLQQLNLEEDEEGTKTFGCQFIPGWSSWKLNLTEWRTSETGRIPDVLVPGGWKLDLARQNVSPGIRLLAEKIAAASERSSYPKENLAQLPWLVQLCEHTAPGKMRWENPFPLLGDADRSV